MRAQPLLACALTAATLSACDLPLGLGLPTTRSMESAATQSLQPHSSLEVTGSYAEGTTRWSIDLQVGSSSAEHVTVSTTTVKLEAIILGNDVYYRGEQFLSDHMGSDLVSRSFVAAAGNGWWKGSAGNVPRLTNLTDGNAFASTFLGQAVTQRIDHVGVDGRDTAELSGPRADVFVAEQVPYQVLRIRLKHGVVVDGIRDGDLHFGNYGHDFHISAPADVIDFSNLSTLPPIYTVLSVDTSACATPCVVSAQLKNLGGVVGARAPSTITFTMTDPAVQQTVGSCQVQVVPDVAYNATTTVGCTIASLSAQQSNAAVVTATPTNPGRG